MNNMMKIEKSIRTEVNYNKILKLYLQDHGRLSIMKSKKNEQIKFTRSSLKNINWPTKEDVFAWISPEFIDKPHGFVNTNIYSKRRDMVAFRSAYFNGRTRVIGKLKLYLAILPIKENTTFLVKICEYTKDSDYINIKDGIVSVSACNDNSTQTHSAREKVELNISLGNVAWQMKKGSRLVVLIAASNFLADTVQLRYKDKFSESIKKTSEEMIYIGKESYLEVPLSYDEV